MRRTPTHTAIAAGIFLSVLGALTLAAQEKYKVSVPNGLAFSEFRGYEAWQLVSISHNGDQMAAILANSEMIKAYQGGIPGNGKPTPNGAKVAKIHWNLKRMETYPAATVPDTQHDIDFMERQQEICGQRRVGIRRVRV